LSRSKKGVIERLLKQPAAAAAAESERDTALRSYVDFLLFFPKWLITMSPHRCDATAAVYHRNQNISTSPSRTKTPSGCRAPMAGFLYQKPVASRRVAREKNFAPFVFTRGDRTKF